MSSRFIEPPRPISALLVKALPQEMLAYIMNSDMRAMENGLPCLLACPRSFFWGGQLVDLSSVIFKRGVDFGADIRSRRINTSLQD